MEQKRTNRRKKKLIDRSTQGKIAFIVLSYVFLYILVFAFFIFVPLAYQMQTESISFRLQEVASAFITLHEHFWPATLVVFFIIALHSIRVSHRMAGPVFRFKETMKSIQKKDLSKNITLRKGDFFADLMEEINRATESISEGIKDIKAKDENLYQAIQGLTAKVERGTVSIEELKESVTGISKNEERLRQVLEEFKVRRNKEG
ncbi:MAG: hypothetical protein ACE5IH_02465 [Thermodesulfobacteriota bacterium]